MPRKKKPIEPSPVVTDDDHVRCPKCGHVGDWDDYDCLGACNGNVFCNACGAEFDTVTGEIHVCSRDAMEAAWDVPGATHCHGDTVGSQKDLFEA